MSDYLPDDLLSNILTRLALRNLLRCTSVCKSWNSLIASPRFINAHLNQTISNNQTPLLLVRHCTNLNDRYRLEENYSIRCDNDDTLGEFAQVDFPLVSKENICLRIVATCNGLVCLSDDLETNTDIIFLWNPSLKKSFTLPKPPLSSVVRKPCGRIWHSIRFGMDPVTNDCKIVRLTCSPDRVFEPPNVELFELSTGSWRNINVPRDFGYFPWARQAFFNGVIHWAGHNMKYELDDGNSSIHTVIVSFDTRNDTLGFIFPPPSVQKHRNCSTLITLFGESLSLFHLDVNQCWCIWVMKEYGVESSWTKQFSHFTIDLQSALLFPTFFRANGDIILVRRYFSREEELISYDPKSKLIRILNIHGRNSYVGTYKESLVLIKGLNEVLGRKKSSSGAITCQRTSVPCTNKSGKEANVNISSKARCCFGLFSFHCFKPVDSMGS